MRLVIFVLLMALVACDTPSPAFRGIDPVRITLGDSTFDVRVNGTQAEAIRLNAQWAPRLSTVAPFGVAAIEKVSGCRVRKLYGDQALMTARLDCGQPLQPLPRGNRYDCDVYTTADTLAEMTCDRVQW